MEKLDSTFETFHTPETYHRVDGVHQLDLYVGIDDIPRWSLLLICDSEPPALESSKMISVSKRIRSDGRWALSLSLKDDAYKDIFLLFCGDIIGSTRSFTSRKTAVDYFARRYREWREMLADSRGELLSPNEVKGLLGEMYFLLHYLTPKYGIEKAALSWTGPRKLPQDFILDDSWYEAKTISSGKSEVLISSVEQLDCCVPGELIVIQADKTSTTNERGINLNQVFHQLLDLFPGDLARSDFCSMLLKYGYYPRPEYETSEYTFEIKNLLRYAVSSGFPCLRRNEIPTSVVKAEYSISLPSIESFKKE